MAPSSLGFASRTKTGGEQLVASMLPMGVGLGVNLMSHGAVDAFERAREDLTLSTTNDSGRPGRAEPAFFSTALLRSWVTGRVSGVALPWINEFDAEACLGRFSST